jgi:protein-S-isoprenylcysteine O-methyltransferase Ste14
MITVIKNIISLILPITVLIVVPRWIENEWIMESNLNLAAGILVGLTGLSIMFVTISSFIRIGKGTLAPWSPTKKLVIAGLYRYVRNPMILGVLIVLLAEAIVFSSKPILKWAGWFYIINTVYFILYEEPNLEERFGDDYVDYKKQVNRWLPRLTPFSDGRGKMN